METVEHLLAAGYSVFAGARQVDLMDWLASAGAHVSALDVTDDASMTSAVRTLLRNAGRLDVLVNTAGYRAYGALEDVPLEEGRRQFDVNIFGLARLIQLVLPTMRAQWSGRIVNVCSSGAKFGGPFGSWHPAATFAVAGLSDSLRMELHPFDIDVVLIRAGANLTEANKVDRDGLMKRSGMGPYANGALSVVKATASADRRWRPLPARVVADSILHALQVRKPKARYAVGRSAKMLLLMRRVLSDRAFDASMRMFQRQAIKART